MKRISLRAAQASLAALAVLSVVGTAAAQDRRYSANSADAPDRYQQRDEGGGFFGLFGGGGDRGRTAARTQAEEPQYAQMSAPDLAVRLERLENQIRQLTGSIEQLQHRNQQLEQQVRRNQEDVEYRLQEMSGGRGAPPPRPQQHSSAPAPQPAASAPAPLPAPATVAGAPAPAPAGGRRSDAFDPNVTPNAPGAPRTLGSIPTRTASRPVVDDEPPAVVTPGGREAGAPLDIGRLSELPGGAADEPPPAAGPSAPPRQIPGALPAPPPRNPSATGGRQVLASAPSASPRDEFALAQGFVQRRDYVLAEEGFREFIKNHPADRLVADAHYWLGESLFQRQRYRDAAESFLTVSTKYDKSAKAPEALLRLGQSLAALGEREAACATLGEVGRKFPRAASVKQNAEREQKRARC